MDSQIFAKRATEREREGWRANRSQKPQNVHVITAVAL